MKKSGLQKQIAFIFDGENAASNSAAISAADTAFQSNQRTAVMEHPAADNGRCASIACSAPTLRPQPIPRKQNSNVQSVSLKMTINSIKSRVFSTHSKKNPNQQKNLTLLIAVLAAVFVGILIFVLGSAPSSAAAAATSQNDTPSASTRQNAGVNVWKKPEPYPATLRDPMKWPSHTSSDRTDGEGLIVRGIVYSETNPTAIISGQIVSQGDVISNVKILKITKDCVEFEKDNKQWKQQVEK